MKRLLVAGVGNVLRTDDGFGPAVVRRLGGLPDAVKIVETGIGGMALLHELMEGYDGLIVVDTVDRGSTPGTVFEIEPDVGEVVHVPDIHLANPERVFNMAKGIGVLPERLVIIGCQPEQVEELGEALTPAVERAVDPAAALVEETVWDWLELDSDARAG